MFEYLDDPGTTVSTLAERAKITKQAMAELVQHLERHGYVERVPNPDDRRSKLVRPTRKGREVVEIAQELVPEVERQIEATVGARRARDLRRDLAALTESVDGSGSDRQHRWSVFR